MGMTENLLAGLKTANAEIDRLRARNRSLVIERDEAYEDSRRMQARLARIGTERCNATHPEHAVRCAYKLGHDGYHWCSGAGWNENG